MHKNATVGCIVAWLQIKRIFHLHLLLIFHALKIALGPGSLLGGIDKKPFRREGISICFQMFFSHALSFYVTKTVLVSPKWFWSDQIYLHLTIMIWSRPKWNGHDQIVIFWSNESHLDLTNSFWSWPKHFGQIQSIWSDQNHFGPTKTVLVT